jgi:hypothetical protein
VQVDDFERRRVLVSPYDLCKRMGHPPSAINMQRCLCGAKRYRIASMFRDLRDLCSLGQHLRKHGL